MPTPPIRIGLIGLGRAGNFHLQSLRLMDDAKVVCVCDTDRAKAQQVAERLGCRATDTAADAIQGDDIDAVIVATPTDFHFECVQQSLEARKPTLTEKPLGRHLHEIDACFNKAEACQTPLFIAFQRRFDPAFASLVHTVRDGGIGQLQFVRSVSRDNPVPSIEYIRTSGGIFHDCMVHDLDMVYHIVGEVPTHLSSFGSSFLPGVAEAGDFDNVVASMTFPSGITASIDINRKSVFGYDQRIEAFGDAGMLQADNYHNTSIAQAGAQGFHRPPVDHSFPTRYREAYLNELKCFVQCAAGQVEVPITHHDVRVNHLLASGLEIAAKQKRVVEFAEVESLLND